VEQPWHGQRTQPAHLTFTVVQVMLEANKSAKGNQMAPGGQSDSYRGTKPRTLGTRTATCRLNMSACAVS